MPAKHSRWSAALKAAITTTFVVPVMMPAALEAQLPDTIRLAEIRVVGTRANLSGMPGAATVLSGEVLRVWRSTTTNDVLRQVPGIVVREEEGLGLRPNIGIRGLNPTRSTKVLLLEDGVPITFSPYGDNASYYHPPVGRFERVEVLRGSGQIMFGPQTVGGVINYITPPVPARASGTASVSGGSRGFADVMARAGGQLGRIGALVSYGRRQGEGARDHVVSTLDDLMVKGTASPGDGHALTLRGNGYRERSNMTYSGLTEAEWSEDPRQNPFRNDSMRLDRWGASGTHLWLASSAFQLTTTLYGSRVSRDWWRQSSNSGERPNDRSDPLCGGLQNLSTTCGNQGRLRDYRVFGIEPRVRAQYSLLGTTAELEAGFRWHTERQERRQVNGATPLAREPGPSANPNSGTVEYNLRTNEAWSAFVQQRLVLRDWSVTPGVRIEHVMYRRTNQLADPDVTGRTELTQLVPGAGVTFRASEDVTLFGGVHRGFSPPRTEDIIDNATGGTIELDPELSWNYEAGARALIGPLNLEATVFRLDFENQIVPASVAGGTGAALTNAGRTLHQGLELGGRVDGARLLRQARGPYLEGVLTWVPAARFKGERYAYVGTGAGDVIGKVYAAQSATGGREQQRVTGKRLPYTPRTAYSLALGFGAPEALDLRLEIQGVGKQFGDALNSNTIVDDGQQGPLPAYRIWNASAMHRFARTGSALFISVKNIGDHLYIADRTRGLLPGAPRTLHAGIAQAF